MTAGRGCGRATGPTPPATSRTWPPRRPTGSTPARPSSTARSWRSTRPADRPSRCSRRGPATSSGETPACPSPTRSSTCSTSTGESLLDQPLEARKARLQGVLRAHPLVRYAGHVEADGEALFESVKAEGLEGMMAKQRSSRYEPGRRSHAWLKVKNRPEQEFVVAGWEPGSVAHRDLGSLVLAVHDDAGQAPVRRRGGQRAGRTDPPRPARSDGADRARHQPLRLPSSPATRPVGRAAARGPRRVRGVDP